MPFCELAHITYCHGHVYIQFLSSLKSCPASSCTVVITLWVLTLSTGHMVQQKIRHCCHCSQPGHVSFHQCLNWNAAGVSWRYRQVLGVATCLWEREREIVSAAWKALQAPSFACFLLAHLDNRGQRLNCALIRPCQNRVVWERRYLSVPSSSGVPQWLLKRDTKIK